MKKIFDIKTSQMAQNNNMLTNPAGAARPAGSRVLNGVTVTLNGSNLMIESNSGWINLQLTAQQVAQMNKEFNDLATSANSLGQKKTAGFQIMPEIDKKQHPQRPGLEGPIRLKSGKIVYYDAQEGRYYDAGTDMYLEDSDYEAHQQERPNPHLPGGV